MKIIFTSIVLLVFCINTMAQDPAYPPGPAASLNIVKAEYFFNTDPGFGLANDIPLTAAIDIANLVATIDISGLSAGAHNLTVRTLNAEGNWSITSTKSFGIDPAYSAANPAGLNITKVEYFIDTDPGFGLATDVPITAATEIANLTTSVNINGLPMGAHNLILRSQNAEGEWSITSVKTFGIDPNYPTAPPAPLNIVKAEYFFDTDPGFSLATDIPITAAVDITNFAANLNISSIAIGAHNLIVRTQNVEGEWSITSVKVFGLDPAYPPAPPVLGNITRIEYFYDTDPGFGNGISATITPATEIANLDIIASLGGLTAGPHKFYIRCLDDWSLTSAKEFSLPADVLPLNLLSFSGKNLGSEVLLNWKTANEKNFSHFEIERSIDLKKFEKIGKVQGNLGENYDYLDSSIGSQNSSFISHYTSLYYRLKMIDLDGNFSFSKIISIENKTNKDAVGQFYPNPSSDKVFVNITANESGNWNITFFDLTGRIMNSEAKYLQKGLNKISIEKLNQGVNFVRFESGNVSEIRKILKE